MANLVKRKQVEDQGHQVCYACRDGNNQPNGALRREDQKPTDERPFIAFFDGEIYALACGDRAQSPATATWTMEVEVNGGVVASIVKPTGASEAATELAIPVSINQNDRIALFMRSQSEAIRDPSGQVAIRKRR